jgi:hypothetical protein
MSSKWRLLDTTLYWQPLCVGETPQLPSKSETHLTSSFARSSTTLGSWSATYHPSDLLATFLEVAFRGI